MDWHRVRKIIASFFVTLGVILVFAGIDYCFHQLSTRYEVPPRYFPNKIIYGTIFGFILFWLLYRFRPVWLKAFIFSAVISILLQIRYFFEGYPIDFVILFLFIHWAILWLLSWAAFKWIKI